jgi:phospholipid/cholesterol/gamma-HCH transport system substrate-binding protein
MRKSAIDVWVGNMNAVSFQPTYTITARFDNIGGLKPRAPVKSAGVVVGRIADIRFDDTTYQATVTMTLERSYQFPKDSAAKILTSGLLGEQYVGLEAGGSDQMLAQGNMITQTQSAVVLENLISQFLYNKAADGGKDESAKK